MLQYHDDLLLDGYDVILNFHLMMQGNRTQMFMCRKGPSIVGTKLQALRL